MLLKGVSHTFNIYIYILSHKCKNIKSDFCSILFLLQEKKSIKSKPWSKLLLFFFFFFYYLQKAFMVWFALTLASA